MDSELKKLNPDFVVCIIPLNPPRMATHVKEIAEMLEKNYDVIARPHVGCIYIGNPKL